MAKSDMPKIVSKIESGWDEKHFHAWQSIRAQVDNIYQCLRVLDEILDILLKK
jgi:hypothetical protein